MSDQDPDQSVDERVARLERQVEGLLEVVAAQAAALERAALPTVASVRAEPGDELRSADPAIGRRRLLVGGVTATAAAAAAVVAGSASPAAAANGGNLILGQNNTATAETKLTYGGTGNNGFRVEGASSLAMIEGYQTGSAPGVKGAHSGAGDGVVGLSATGNGVYGESEGIGAFGKSAFGVGVRGESDFAAGVVGESQAGVGLRGTSSGNIGIEGVSGGGFAGVRGESAGTGVQGVSTDGGIGVKGQSTGNGVSAVGLGSGRGVKAEAVGAGEGLFADSALGIGVAALGARANLYLPARSGRAAPSGDATPHSVGEVVVDGSGAVWLCIADGTPGEWRKIGGPQTAGQFHVLPAPARIVDTRPGTVPGSVLPKTPLDAGTTRVYDLKVNSSGVPAGATAALITVLLVNASNGNGNMTLWANGVARPTANTMVWGAGSGRWTATAVSALDSQARVQVNVSAKTDLVLDVVGYYR